MLAIVAQQLVPASNGTGRYPAVEIMMGTHAVRNLIRRGDDHQLYTAISIGTRGRHDHDGAIAGRDGA